MSTPQIRLRIHITNELFLFLPISQISRSPEMMRFTVGEQCTAGSAWIEAQIDGGCLHRDLFSLRGGGGGSAGLPAASQAADLIAVGPDNAAAA